MIGIQGIVDVRNNPLSRKYGFSRVVLERTCGRLGLRYTHLGSLGVPSAYRRELHTPDDLDAVFDWYETTVLDESAEAIRLLGEMMAGLPSVLLCYEKSASHCHRGRLATRIASTSGLSICHI